MGLGQLLRHDRVAALGHDRTGHDADRLSFQDAACKGRPCKGFAHNSQATLPVR